MICEECGEDKEDVTLQTDPFQEELYRDETLHYLCEDCANQLAADI
jgi:protein-arginine kinase activator protein McsA